MAAASAAVASAKPSSPHARPRRVAIGDPQAPIERFLEILDRHDLLGDDGALHRDVLLVSLGDHFDWGAVEERERAADSGYRLLAWLASHAADQVVIMASNHDFSRVGELAGFDERTWAEARQEAIALRAIPMGTTGRQERRHAFLERWRVLPSVGVLVRDWGTFETRQRDLVAALVRGGRYQAAWAAADDLLFVHAALTPDDLDLIQFPAGPRGDARAIAGAVQVVLSEAVAGWNGGALSVGELHRPGSYADGESRGILVQRPADPDTGDMDLFRGPPRRRFDPRILSGMAGVTQVVGHIRDNKCRDLMPRWHDRAPSRDGPLRHLWTDGSTVRYARGMPHAAEVEQIAGGRAAGMIFTDGGMNHTDPAQYELFDLDARQPLTQAR